MNAPSRRAPIEPLPRKAVEGTAKPGRQKDEICPICNKPTAHDYRPFCSKRCADIDLGRWLGGRYAVPGEPLARDKFEPDDE
ncbi:MAG: DNA gyrase inhibitor YacG [Methyloceanibacter sp.]